VNFASCSQNACLCCDQFILKTKLRPHALKQGNFILAEKKGQYIIYSLKGEWTNNKSIVDGNMIYNTTIIDISNENKANVTFKFQNNKGAIQNMPCYEIIEFFERMLSQAQWQYIIFY
jgi:hypothetical protein